MKMFCDGSVTFNVSKDGWQAFTHMDFPSTVQWMPTELMYYATKMVPLSPILHYIQPKQGYFSSTLEDTDKLGS